MSRLRPYVSKFTFGCPRFSCSTESQKYTLDLKETVRTNAIVHIFNLKLQLRSRKIAAFFISFIYLKSCYFI